MKPKDTTYAKLLYPNRGYDYEANNASSLIVGEYYEVEAIYMGQSHTSVRLKNHPRKTFTSVAFEFYDKDKNGIDIFEMPEFNPYLPQFGDES